MDYDLDANPKGHDPLTLWLLYDDGGNEREWRKMEEEYVRRSYDSLLAHGYTPTEAVGMIDGLTGMIHGQYGN